MDFNVDVDTFVVELDAQRCAMGMSYQDVADACDVSKATIYRALTGKTEPTMQLLKNIAAAVQFRPARGEILPDELTQEAYIAYLKDLVHQKNVEIEFRAKQLHAHYNKLLKQRHREKTIWVFLALSLAATFVVLFIYDFAHLDRGWIQAEVSKYMNTGFLLFRR